MRAVLVCVLAVACVTSVAEYTDSLRLVNVIFRHGERTPADTYPNDPHLKFDFHPFGWGQLTNEGKLHQYQQGKFLRERYNKFLGDVFSNEAVRVQSTDVDRTIMSAQLACAGLFPPVAFQKWNSDLEWQPVPVHSQPLSQDSLLLVRIPCPRYHEELETVKSSGELKQILNAQQDLYAALTRHSGMTIHDPDDVQSLYNTLLAEKNFNLTLPEWTREYFPEKLAAITAFSFSLNVYNDELKKIKGGPLLKKILQDSESKSKNVASKQKIFVYAGHDSTVANVMMALGVWDEQIPVYNIMAMIELHQVNNVYGLKVFLRNSTEHELYLLRVPGCEDFCPLDKVMELSKNVLPRDLAEECISHDPNYKPPSPSGP